MVNACELRTRVVTSDAENFAMTACLPCGVLVGGRRCSHAAAMRYTGHAHPRDRLGQWKLSEATNNAVGSSISGAHGLVHEHSSNFAACSYGYPPLHYVHFLQPGRLAIQRSRTRLIIAQLDQYVAHLLDPSTTSTKFSAMIRSVCSDGCSGSYHRKLSGLLLATQSPPVTLQWLTYPVTSSGADPFKYWDGLL